jgi:glycosyltransferase involved in cell wall biosynthesis
VKRHKLLFLVTEDWYFCSHRLPVAREAQRQGFEVVVATKVGRHGKQISAEGFKLVPLQLQRRSTNPLRELSAIIQLIDVYLREKPDIVHHVAMKPVLYGSLAACLTGVPHVVNALAGMGYVFISNQLKAQLLRPFIRAAFRLLLNRVCSRLILQNKDDSAMFISSALVNKKRIRLIRGAGVDTEMYHPVPEPAGPPVVLLASRMLWDKGIGEFVEAAKLLQTRSMDARFVLVGDTDSHNPAAISSDQLSTWHAAGTVAWWGRRDDMPVVLAQSHIVCLPSYREGLPKVLLEAASCGRPIVTTDTNGCREVVRHGENGFLVPVKSIVELTDALQRLIENPELRRQMGAQGRKIAVQEFAVEKVVSETMVVYEELLKP